MTSWFYSLYHSFWDVLDLIFPLHGGGGGKIGSRWCVDCQKRVHFLRGALCEICGLPLEKATTCNTCQRDGPHYRRLRARAAFGDLIQTALYKLKYRRDVSLGDALAFQMISFVRELNCPIEVSTPIPLGSRGLKERGFNEAGMIAKPLARALNLQYAPNELMRCKETRSQVGRTRRERTANVNKAIKAGAGVRKKIVLVMDDFSTTGSTLSSSAGALYLSGAKDVYALTVARAMPQHGLQHV